MILHFNGGPSNCPPLMAPSVLMSGKILTDLITAEFSSCVFHNTKRYFEDISLRKNILPCQEPLNFLSAVFRKKTNDLIQICHHSFINKKLYQNFSILPKRFSFPEVIILAL